MKIGIDLGTSYSSIAAEINGKIEIIKVSTGASAFGDSFSMPTAVYVDNESILLGQAALGKRKISPKCFKNEFKRDFGTMTPYILSGEEYLPEQLYTEIFLYFKEQAVKQMGEKVESVYLTHPANYGNNKKRLLEKAANNAGLFDVVLIDEPTAAAAGYSQKNKINDGDILLVYDLGGGTFDVALIKKTEKGYMHLAEPLGISQCGGIDFDRVIFEDIIRKMGEEPEFDTKRLLMERRFTAALSEVCIQIKHQLSQAQSHTEPIAVGAYDYFEYTITRQEFEDMIKPLVTNTCEKVRDILKNSGLVASDIDRVLLVGGSSRIPLVQKMIKDTLKKDISLDSDPELAVCHGAVSLGIIMQDQETIRNKKEEQVNEAADIQRYKEDGCLEPIEEIIGNVLLGDNAYDGEWIYYTGKDGMPYKIKTDGTKKTRLNNRISEDKIMVEGEWIYYQADSDEDSNSHFYKIRKNGKDDTKIGKEPVPAAFSNNYTVKDGWIYFINTAHNNSLCRMSINGSHVMTLGDDTNVFSLTMKEDWIYYVNFTPANELNLCRISTDGIKRKKIYTLRRSENGIPFIFGIAVFDKWFFYRTFMENSSPGKVAKSELWKIHVDDSQNYRVLDDCGDMLFFNIIGGQLYYDVCRDDKTYIYKMNLDGANVVKLSPKMLQQEIKTLE